MSAIEVDHVSKKFQLGLTHARTLQEATRRATQKLTNLFRRPSSPASEKSASDSKEFWALRDVNFAVKPGEVMGIIGQNGAGKSTLLKILSRVTPPTQGHVRVRGRLASLLEVGTGFHPELTGRENIYLNAALLGMTRKEVSRKLDAIVDFAGVEKFLDTPVKRYSTGMTVRLGFAVAAHLEPEILVIDEVLAVGDAEFQRRCLGKMQAITQDGRTVLFVSHNMAAVTSLCPNSVLLHKGEVQVIGPSSEVVAKYLDQNTQAVGEGFFDLSQAARNAGDGEIRFQSLRLFNKDQQATANLGFREPFEVEVAFQSNITAQVEVGLTIKTADGVSVLTTTNVDTAEHPTIQPGLYSTRVPIDPNILKPGRYYLLAGITAGVCQDLISEAASFDIIPSEQSSFQTVNRRPGLVEWPYQWKPLTATDA